MHIPVLKDKVIEYLAPTRNENFIDCTIGAGGHSVLILEKNKPDGKVLGIEADPAMFSILRAKKIKRLILVRGSYINLKSIAGKNNFQPNGVLFDLGMSSWHIDESGRGFSITKDEPLDMRYYPEYGKDAGYIVNRYSEKEIEEILREFGGERFSKRIAKSIVSVRKQKPITRTSQLKDIVIKAIPPRFRRSRIHCATRTFQAIRIAVNDELDNLRAGLDQAMDISEPLSRIVVISFHSGEDKIVKNFFREKYKQGLIKILTKKPVRAGIDEINTNPRSRSARLRAAIKL